MSNTIEGWFADDGYNSVWGFLVQEKIVTMPDPGDMWIYGDGIYCAVSRHTTTLDKVVVPEQALTHKTASGYGSRDPGEVLWEVPVMELTLRAASMCALEVADHWDMPEALRQYFGKAEADSVIRDAVRIMAEDGNFTRGPSASYFLRAADPDLQHAVWLAENREAPDALGRTAQQAARAALRGDFPRALEALVEVRQKEAFGRAAASKPERERAARQRFEERYAAKKREVERIDREEEARAFGRSGIDLFSANAQNRRSGLAYWREIEEGKMLSGWAKEYEAAGRKAAWETRQRIVCEWNGWFEEQVMQLAPQERAAAL